MKSLNDALELSEKDKLMDELKEHVRVRDTMGGSLYRNVMNDECCAIATRCARLGCDRAEIAKTLGRGNFM